MLPQYTSIPNQDNNEKQPLQGHSCPCAANANTNDTISQCCHQQKRKPSKWAIITLGVVGYLFISHMSDSHHYHYHYDSNDNDISVKNHRDDQLINDQGWGIHCFGPDSPNIPWGGKSVYDTFDSIKGLTLNHDKSSHNNYNIYSKGGKFVVAKNSELSQPRVTFDIKVSNNNLKETIEINESKSLDDFKLVLKQDNKGYHEGCVVINALVEVPTSDTLQDISFDLIYDDIIIQDELKLNGTFKGKTISGDIEFLNTVVANGKVQLDTKSGDITIKEISSSPSFAITTVSGDASGHFALINGGNGGNVSDFNVGVASGDVSLVFDSITPAVSTITAKSISGDVDIKLPSDFESRFAITTISGDTQVKAKNAKDLHSTKIKRRPFKSIEGYYGNDENSSNVIKASTKSGDVDLKYN